MPVTAPAAAISALSALLLAAAPADQVVRRPRPPVAPTGHLFAFQAQTPPHQDCATYMPARIATLGARVEAQGADYRIAEMPTYALTVVCMPSTNAHQGVMNTLYVAAASSDPKAALDGLAQLAGAFPLANMRVFPPGGGHGEPIAMQLGVLTVRGELQANYATATAALRDAGLDTDTLDDAEDSVEVRGQTADSTVDVYIRCFTLPDGFSPDLRPGSPKIMIVLAASERPAEAEALRNRVRAFIANAPENKP